MTDQENYNSQKRQYEKRKQLLEKFSHGQELYSRNPLFRATFEHLARGVDPFTIIEQLIDVNAQLHADYQAFITKPANQD